ncbi:MAG: vWA domain-containing protein [Actinomycetota bacterium]
MSFGAPALLWALLLVPLLVWGYLRLQRRGVPHAVRFTNLELAAAVAAPVPRLRRALPPLVLLLGLTSLLVGIARPQAATLVPRQEATVIMVFDTSGSMSERDVGSSRIEAARTAALEFLNQLPEQFQVGLVTFSDQAHIQAQPTVDREVVQDAIRSLSSTGATAMGDALTRALTLDPLEREGRRERRSDDRPLAAILLLSDGFNTAGRIQPLEAAVNARRRRLPVFTIALGPTPGELREMGPFLAQAQSPPDHYTLRRIAEITRGRYFRAPTEEDLRAIYDNLASRLGFVEDKTEITFAFAGAGLLLAISGAFLSAVWGGRFP